MSKPCLVLPVLWLLLEVFCFELAGAAGKLVPANTPFTIDVWETEDGLPRNSVIAMTQTRDGYLWLGTLNGLARFDGIHFTVFNEDNTPGLRSSRIVSLFEDSRSNLWIGTQTAGAALIKDGAITNLSIEPGATAGILDAREDARGGVWLYTTDGQLRRYRDGQPDLAVPANYREIIDIIAEKSGVLWDADFPRAAKRQMYFFTSERGGYWRLADGRVHMRSRDGVERDWGPYPWKGAKVSAACEDRQGNLVVGTQGAGLFWFDQKGKATPLSTEQGLSHDYILSLLVDHEGNLWVGTDGGGLNRVKRKVFDLLEETRGLVVQSVSEDNQAVLWIGVSAIGFNANAVGALKPGGIAWFAPGPNAFVGSVFADRSGRIWAGTGAGLARMSTNGLFQRELGPAAIQARVRAIHQDREGHLWVGTQAGLAKREESRWRVLTTNDVQAMADDAEGNLWVGSVGGRLDRLRNDQVTPFLDGNQMHGKDITSLYADDAGVLWVGTDGNGLVRVKGSQWTRYTTREGLSSDSVGSIIEDGHGYLWIGSSAGLMRVKKKALDDFANDPTTFIPFRAYRKQDGLPTSECPLGSQPGACRARDGTLWLPTIKGLVSVNPSQLNPNSNPPPLMIESVLIDSQTQNSNRLQLNWAGGVTVPAGKESVEIHFTSLNLAAPERARFKYRLAQHETGWTDSGNIRVARYIKLPPGHYRFQVTACNEDGVWNETGSSLALVVLPPFWRTWWFLTATIACLLGTIVAVVHYLSTQRLQRQLADLRQQEALEKERARIARDIHDQLGASLTQVSLLSELVESDKDSPGEVETHARQISQTARDTSRALDQIVWTVNPSNDTLDGLITYVCKYAQEYLGVAGLRYRQDVPAQLPERVISPEVRHNVFLATQEAVTNVVRHAQAEAVWLRLKLEPETFTIEIQDDGRGPAGMEENRARSRNGLRNMAKRMEDVGGSFSIGPGPEGGTLVRLSAPIGKA